MNGATLISASIQGGVLALVALLILLAVPTMPPLAKVWIWRIVFLKFALGIVGIGNIPLAVLPAPPVPEVTVASEPDDSVAYETLDTGAVAMPLVLSEPKREFPWVWLYVAGAGAVGVHTLFGTRKTARMVRRAEPVTESWALHVLGELAHEAGIRKVPRLLESAETKTALLAWSLRPAILLPAGLVAEGSDVSADLRLMLAHEVAHLAHRDLMWNLLAAAVKGIFFFHPLVWLSAGRSQVAQETAADERAVRMTGTSLKEYGEMLLRATVASSAFRAIPGAVAIAGSVRSLQERLNAMSKLSEKPPLGLRIAAFAAIAALFPGYCLVAKAQASPPQKPAPLAPVKKTTKPARRNHVVREEGTYIVSAEGNMLAFIPSRQRTSIDWIRFDPVTGNVTDGWRMDSTWDGKKYGNPVWTRIDPATKKKTVIRDDGNSTWTRVVDGKVVAIRRPSRARASSLLRSYRVAPQVFAAPAGQAGGLAPSVPPSPAARPGSVGLPQPGMAPASVPRATAGSAPAGIGTASAPAVVPTAQRGAPAAGAAGGPGFGSAAPASPGVAAAPRSAGGQGFRTTPPAIVSSPSEGVSTGSAAAGVAVPMPPRGSMAPAQAVGGNIPPREVPPAPAVVVGNAPPMPAQRIAPPRNLPPTPKATKKTPKHRKHRTMHKPK